MRAELAIQLAQSETQDKTLNQVMRRANEIFEASGGSGTKPFPQVDVVFATFVDHLKATGTQRERDLVLASDLLQRVWLTSHSPMHQGEKGSPADERDLSLLAPALLRLGRLHLLTEGLTPAHQQRIQSVAQALSEADAKPAPVKSVELSAAERTELLDWVSACQSAYSLESHPRGPFMALPGQLQENREDLVAYVNELLEQRANHTMADPVQAQHINVPFCRVEDVYDNDSLLALMGVKRGDLLYLRQAASEPVAWRDPSNSDPGQGCTYDKAKHEQWPHIYKQPLYAGKEK